MKRIYFALIICVSVIFISCEDFKLGDNFLDKPPSSDQTIDTVFSSAFYAEQALNKCYSTLRTLITNDHRHGYRILSLLSDDVAGKRGTNYHDGTQNASVTQMYELPSSELRILWTFLENVDRVPDFTEQEKKQKKAEVKVLLAYHYTEMFRYHGGMPWIDHAYLPGEETDMKRMTVAEHVSKVVELCDEAAAVLPWKHHDDDHGRMTSAAAQALKFRILLHAASPLFNNNEPFKEGEASDAHYTWYGNYDVQRWQDALDAGLDFLKANQDNGNLYKMVMPESETFEAYRNAFADAYLERNNGEIIFPIQSRDRWNINMRIFQDSRFGSIMPSLEFVNTFERIEDGSFPDINNKDHMNNPYFAPHKSKAKYSDLVHIRDPRLYETCLLNEDKWYGRKAEVYNGGREGPGASGKWKNICLNGFGLRKWTRDHKSEIIGKPFVNAYIRLPDIYLGIAECMTELDKTGPDKFGHDVFWYINQTRKRVGLFPVVPLDPSGILADRIVCNTKEKLIDAILNERRVEFHGEEVRYHDLNRRKLSKALQYDRHMISTEQLADGSFVSTRLPFTLSTFAWCDNWDNKYYLVPLPQDEISKGYGLVQNPGW